MIQMFDSEGAELPTDCDGGATFEICLFGCGGNDGKPWMGLDVPARFLVERNDGTDSLYDSEGLLTVDLRDVLEDYLQREHMEDDGGVSLPVVEALLREYADKIADVKRALDAKAVAD